MQNSENGKNDWKWMALLYNKIVRVCEYPSCGRECRYDIVDESVEHNRFDYLYYLYILLYVIYIS